MFAAVTVAKLNLHGRCRTTEAMPSSCATRQQVSTEQSDTHTNYTVSQKKGPTLKRYSSKLYGSILMIFDRNIQKALE